MSSEPVSRVVWFRSGLFFIKSKNRDIKNKKVDQEVSDEIIKSIQGIDFGEVVITVHNSKVVQIEKKVKKRF